MTIQFGFEILNYSLSTSSGYITNNEGDTITAETYNYINSYDILYSGTNGSDFISQKYLIISYNEYNGLVDSGNLTNEIIKNFVSSNYDFSIINKKIISELNKQINPRIYKWYIYEMQVLPEFNGSENFVSKVVWRYNATSISGQTANIQGTTTYNQLSNPYVPYQNLTEEIVSSWLDLQENIDTLRENLDYQIDFLMHPPIVSLPLPWS